MNKETQVRLERSEPFFKHDCERCRYAGSFISVPASAYAGAPGGDGRPTLYDVWVHPREDKSLDGIIMRDGNEGQDYVSFHRRHVEFLMGYAYDDWALALKIVQTARQRIPPRANADPLGDDYEAEPFDIVRWSSRYYGETGESNRAAWVIKFKPVFNLKLTATHERELIAEWFPATQCHHEHDCCGHWYSGTARATQLPNGLWLVSQTQQQNV